MISSNFILLTRFNPANPVSAVMPAAANAGWPVQIDSAGAAQPHMHDDITAFRVANITLGKIFFLTRPVLNATEQPLANLKFGNADTNPTLINEPANGVEVLELEAEGQRGRDRQRHGKRLRLVRLMHRERRDGDNSDKSVRWNSGCNNNPWPVDSYYPTNPRYGSAAAGVNGDR